MGPLLLLLALVGKDTTDPQPYPLGATATAEGARSTVTRLIAATAAADDAGYDRIARGMVIMLAPDFGVPLTRAKFAESLKDCTGLHVVGSAPFPREPKAQAVRVAMLCRDAGHPQGREAVADIMADNEHALVVFPGGVDHVWPASRRRPDPPRP